MAVSFSPGPIENEFAIGVEFEIQQSSPKQTSCFVSTDEMLREPACPLPAALMPLQGHQEFVAEKGVLFRYQSIPFGCEDCGQRIKALNLHE